VGEGLERLEGCVGLAAAEQDAAEADGGLSVARIELERLAERLLVAGLGQPVGLGRDDLVEEGLDLGVGDCADELGDHLAVLERLDRRNALDAELPGNALIRVGVDLGELDLAVPLADGVLDRRAQGPAGTAPLGPEVDDHRHLLRAFDNLGLELLFADV
jgi:hypothetical protein